MNIKEAIEKLQTLDIQDVKNIDLNKLQNLLKQSPIILVNIVMVGAVVFFVITFISKAKLNEKEYNQKISLLEKKVTAINEQNKIKKNYDGFIKLFPNPISPNQLIDKFSELAGNHNIQILSFSSAKESSDNFLVLTTVNLSIESNDYKNIITFIKDIEDSTFAVRLERFTAGLSSPILKNNAPPVKNNIIKADIQVSTLKVK